MHILELPSFFPPHGGLFCLEQAKALKAQGHEVRIVSIVELSLTKDRTQFLTLPWREERSEQEGVEVFCTYMRAVPKAVRCNVNRWTRLCEKAVDRYVRRYGKPDVLHAHCCKSAGLAAKRISQHTLLYQRAHLVGTFRTRFRQRLAAAPMAQGRDATGVRSRQLRHPGQPRACR